MPVNFWNTDQEVSVIDNQVNWEYVTTGGTHAVDLWLDNAATGKIAFKSNVVNFDVDLTALGINDFVQECGDQKKLYASHAYQTQSFLRLSKPHKPSHLKPLRNAVFSCE